MKRFAMILLSIALAGLPAMAFASKGALAEKEYGDAWAELGNWKRAVSHYQKAVKKNPKMTSARLSLANGLYRLGNKKAALAELAALQKNQPRSASVSCAIGVIRLDLGQAQEACQSFDKALEQDQNHDRALYGSGQCHQALFDQAGEPSEKKMAVEAFQAYLDKFPKGSHRIPAKEALEKLHFGEAGKTMAAAKEAFAKGKFRLSEKLLRKVTEDRPDLQEAHYLLAMTLSTPVVNKLDEAAEELTKAPDLKEALLQRGIIAYEEEDLEESEDLLKKVIRLDEKNAQAHYHLALVYKDQFKHDEAIAAFREVSALAPKTALAERANSKLQVMTGRVTFLREGEIIDTSSEIELGRKYTSQIEKQFGVVDDQALQMRLNRILRKVTAHSDRPPTSLPYRVKILNIDGINALAFVGGTIYLCKGLVDFIQRDMDDSDDAFAVVIGHEVVHLVLRHGIGMLDLVGGTRALMEGHSLDVRGINKLMVGMSRKHEFEADQIGCLYAYRAGFNPAAAYQFHRKLISHGKEVPEGLDHPTHAERADRMKEYLLSLRTKARHFDAGLNALDENDFETAIIHFEVFLGMFPDSWSARNNLGVAMHRMAMSVSKNKRGYRLSTDIDPRSRVKPIRLRAADDSAMKIDQALMTEAAEVFRALVRRNPEYLSANLNLGSCLLALGNTAQARAIFENIKKKVPGSPEALTNLAVIQLMEKKTDKGIEILEKVIEKHPEFADAHYNLALALTRSGNQEKARRAWLAFLDRDKSSGWADSARKYLAELK